MKTLILILAMHTHPSLDTVPLMASLHNEDIDTAIASFKTKSILVRFKNGDSCVYDNQTWNKALTPDGQLCSKLENATRKLERTFTKTEIPPSFTGGDEAWQAYIAKVSQDNKRVIKKNAPASVWVQFVVGFDGTVADVSLMGQNVPSSLGELAIKTIKEAPDWVPAKQNGHLVTCYHRVRIDFQ